MVGIKDLQLRNVRSHTNGVFQFAGDMNAIVGPNGSGKTTILEALYTTLRGSSFKSTVADMTQYGSNQFKIEVTQKTTRTDHSRSLTFQQTEGASLRRWKIDNKQFARLPIQARLPVVLFEPDLARLITGSPERRRNYLDILAGQLDIEIASTQHKFERTLKQRNQLLKTLREQTGGASTSDLFVWNTQLAHLSESIVNARHRLLKKLQNEITRYYKDLGGTDDVLLTYQSSVSPDPTNYASILLQFLETSAARDIARGYTGFGPHRDDLEILLADQPAIDRASRGEVRTIVIALKLLETEMLSRHYTGSETRPTLLLDDVLSELDLVHQERVLFGLKDHQVFLTTTDAHALNAGVHTIFLE